MGWTIETKSKGFKYTSPDGTETFGSVKAVNTYLSKKRKATSNNEVERSSKKKKTMDTTSSWYSFLSVHSVQTPGLEPYLPRSHLVQLALPASDDHPTGQLSQVVGSVRVILSSFLL